jgi:hypothetical protein
MGFSLNHNGDILPLYRCVVCAYRKPGASVHSGYDGGKADAVPVKDRQRQITTACIK